ncbi:DUF5518 domain-containing protein [Haloplanus aerogenes]|uniref:DUF5518 domain-containing protein n=1 Tax=Haloplanus aerogenes TaxID=660522 RepID=A0A3M0CYL0_9EURY|nr:DUF5518 domain-containing protein [Haloplanus aerogenes]AZH27027.1 hypothetical protein DU502_17315 [Haloplanus aerogenes]RMB13480.1 hypothetical protein ATH50_2818 [Haloplanus aerogenes]
MVSDSTLHALIGAVVTVVFSFVPFSPVLGGGVAAYLNDADTSDGVRIGALSGLLASVPLLLLGFLLFAIFGIFTVGGPGMNGMAFGIGGLFVLLLVGLVAIAYTVGLSALGGYLGAYFVDGV